MHSMKIFQTMQIDMMNTKKLIDGVVALPVEERALVVDSLLRSLNQPESGMDNKWILVARKRLAKMRSGSVEAIPRDNQIVGVNV